MSAPGVVVTGTGVVSPLGHHPEALTRRVLAGERAPADEHGAVVIDAIPLDALAPDKRGRSGRLDRVCRLALAAAALAVEDAGLAPPASAVAAERVGLAFGTGLGCLLSDVEFYEKVLDQGVAAASPRVFAYTVSSAAAGEISIAFGIHGPNATLHMGLAAGIGAIGYGLDLIRQGTADVVLAGAADANGPALVQALRDMNLLALTAAGSGPAIRPSEGAAFVVLEAEPHARRRDARSRGRLAGYAAGFEPTLTSPEPDRTALAHTATAALIDAGCAPRDIDLVCASAAGTRLDRFERAVLADVLREAEHRVIAPTLALGECFAAGGVLGLAIALELIARGHAHAALIDALCYSGNVGALVVRRA